MALLIGAGLVLFGFLLAEFATFPATGHRVDTTQWPVEAQAILREQPGVPISTEQWKRIDSVLRARGDLNYGQRPYWAQTVRASWWWFLLLPGLAVVVTRFRQIDLSAVTAVLLCAPSAIVLLVGLALSGSAA